MRQRKRASLVLSWACVGDWAFLRGPLAGIYGGPWHMAGRSKPKETPDERAERLETRRKDQAAEETLIWQGIESQGQRALIDLKDRGRPSSYSDELADKLFTLLASGMSLARICKREDMPHVATVSRWGQENPSFRDAYFRAREAQADALFDECLDIADDAAQDVTYDDENKPVFNSVAVQRAKLRIETRMRVAGKLNQRYSDRPLDGANVTINNNTLTMDARALDPEQRERLRNLLLIAKANGEG